MSTDTDKTTGTGHSYQNALDNALSARRTARLNLSVRVIEHRIEATGKNPPFEHIVTVEA